MKLIYPVLVLSLVACLVVALVWRAWVLAIYFGALLANVVVSRRVAHSSARAAYFRGRAEFLASLDEAHARGLTMDQWAEGEMVRDLAKLNDRKWTP